VSSEAVLGSHDEITEARLPAGPVVAVLADARDTERVGDEQVLRVGGCTVGTHHLGGDALGKERADRRAGRGDTSDHHAVRVEHRHATGPREHRLGRHLDETGRDR